MDPVEVAKVEQKKLRKALEHAVRQERKEARKIKKLIDKKDKTATNHSASSSRITLLSVDTVSDCSATSDEDILAEIWAMRSPSLDGASDDDLHAFDDERSETAPIEFLFFTGCPDDKNLRELDVGYRRLRSNPRATRYPVTPSYATSVHIKPTLVSNMPPLFAPHFDIVLG
ncbi:hypothetical protein PR003_g18350 [Phytophthora rubi]|uniref:Uncharacterized protein n=1 Tax=Phytophthora rubi TaxID=129364 RepID=A0A6A3IBP9_9STRA|nr:hypothetical protein PR001_g24931 [Phytophthora rubi]KAE9003737.1 hypothetical protein PR002_g17255 [Phytophthora rubi]KAE9317973.1 hypothetical protein PR003_g18350 [Phytophthora rubi]